MQAVLEDYCHNLFLDERLIGALNSIDSGKLAMLLDDTLTEESIDSEAVAVEIACPADSDTLKTQEKVNPNVVKQGGHDDSSGENKIAF